MNIRPYRNLLLLLLIVDLVQSIQFYTSFTNSDSTADSGISILKSSSGYYKVLGLYTDATYSSILLELASNGTRTDHTHMKFDVSYSPVNEII